MPKAVNDEFVTPVPNDVAESTLLPPILYDCPAKILTDVAAKAPVEALNVKYPFTDAPTPLAFEEVLDRTG